jgi:surface protein
MSLKSIKLSTNQGNISNNRLNNQSIVSVTGYVQDTTVWTKPSGWMDLPAISGGSQKFVGLVRVDPTGNFLAFQFATTTGAGNHLIDWGDGISEYVASSTSAYHEYNYTNISSSGESTLGYRQALVTVTPSGSAIMGAINLNINHNRASLNTNRPNKWLDVAINCSGVTSISIGGNNSPRKYCERVQIFDHNTTNIGQICYNMPKLQSFSMAKTSQITSANNAFSICSSMITAPNLDTSNITSFYQIFLQCYALKNVPLYNTSKVTTFESAFQQCTTLETVPKFDTSSATSFLQMFNSCLNLIEVPLFDTKNVTTMQGMFSSCSNLKTVPCFNTSKVTTMQTMFYNCSNLESLPSFDMSSNTSLFQFASNCTKLRKIPFFNTKNVTQWYNAFAGSPLEELPPLDTSNGVNISAAFAGNKCRSFPSIDTRKATDISYLFNGGGVYLDTIPYFECSGSTSAAALFQSCSRLTSIPLLNISNATSTANMFYNCYNLKTIPSLNTGKSTTTNNMFYNCYNLTGIPYIETSGVTNAAYTFFNCYNLTAIPTLNLSNNTTTQAMFYNCYLLDKCPPMDTSKVTNMGDMFNGCNALTSIPHINATGLTTAASVSNIFNLCYNLGSGSLSGITITHTIANCNFSGPALNTYYTNLGNGTGKTLTVTGNYGVTDDDPSIATAKGWTVTG